jgi:hypothetical protein
MKMVNTMRMQESNKNKGRAIVLVLSGTLFASVLGAAPSHAVIAFSSNHSAKTMTMAEYKVEYVAWLAATKAWNATRVQQVADHMVVRADYKKAAVASQLAMKAILATRTAALAAARQTYLDQAATSTNPVLKCTNHCLRSDHRCCGSPDGGSASAWAKAGLASGRSSAS